MRTSEPHVAVIGGGPAGLFVAERLASSTRAKVTVYERRRSVARTVLLAGRSGLNLTHDADEAALAHAVHDDNGVVHDALRRFTSEDLREWADSLGADTFVGSSGRVFPAAMRGAPLVRAWLGRLNGLGVRFQTEHHWLGWTEHGALRFETRSGAVEVEADATVLALGGASWPRVGSDGAWARPVAERGVHVAELRPANCGFLVDWSPVMRDRHEGTPLKGVRVVVGDASAGGDLMIIAAGLEGTPVYSLASTYGATGGEAGSITIDLQPDRTHDELVAHLTKRRRPKDSASTWLRRAGIQPAAVDLLRDATGNQLPGEPEGMADLLQAVELPVVGLAPLDRAISSAGGVELHELNDAFMVERLPGVFAVGEMLDWDAPTGGYLLQTCFSTAAAAATGVADWLGLDG